MGLISNGTTLLDAGALDSGVPTGVMTLLATATASSSATIDFTSGIDSTYKEYMFKFIDIHPATNETQFAFQVDTGSNTSYGQTITSTFFRSIRDEAGSADPALQYKGEQDQQQGTGLQKICINVGNGNDECCAGTLSLFNQSSATFVKSFIAHTNTYRGEDFTENGFLAGYVNTTTALTRVRFKMVSGNIDAGVIKMYGIK